VTGESEGPTGDYDFTTLAYDLSGSELWVGRHGGPYPNGGLSIDVAPDGDILATGYTSDGFDMSDEDYCTIKFHSGGDTAWVRTYDGLGYLQDRPTKTLVDQAGDIYVTGTSYSYVERDYTTLKYSPDGDVLWLKRYNPSGSTSDWALGMCLDRLGNVYVTGRSNVGAGTLSDWVTIKYRPDGDTAFVARFNGPGDGRDYGYDVVVGDDNKFYVVGYIGQTPEYMSNFDFTTVAYYQYITGDADGSGSIDIDDVVFLIGYIFASGPAPEPLEAGDADCSGEVDIDDVVYLIAYIFSSGPAPGDPDDDGVPNC